MFIVDNHLYEASFHYNQGNDTKQIGTRTDELMQLQDIIECCRFNDEKLVCDLDAFYSAEVEPGVYLCDWLFSGAGEGSHDIREMLLRMLDMITEYEANGDGEIAIALGPFEECICTRKEYNAKRREFLKGLTNVKEFGDFMKSCYQESIFSDNIMDAMKRIPDFARHTEEIVFNLSLLNDEAIEIYKRNGKNAAKAMEELSVKAKECTGDPAHKAYLKFPFTSNNAVEGREEYQDMIIEVECSPHMKLIRPDSNLRIYFYWYNDKIGNGKKVLIGRIGSHPY